ncbi:sensor histidine kinase [Mucilaginibacter glaciei]|uniref:histidine kinase n=1 Tax=Mucilaginibacter glaciei TaxID=2772109 RepID=A0A926NT29_9SPHI|nr:GAF domain-containing sensor histidine kinase [Mucilaginibacter glaciei]MBD1394803.1 GAF domain-containing sensor histidine kinase [Mucilaginibacter glaciei]
MSITAAYPLPENEDERLEALESYHVLDTTPEEDFDELTLLASEICQTPIALISLIDDKRQWFKSHYGLAIDETPKEYAFCAHAIVNPNEVMEIKDSRLDARFANNPLVTGDPHVIFYAGVPLLNEDGHALGSLCVIDNKPKELTAGQTKALRVLAKQVLAQMELRRKIAKVEKANAELLETNAFIQKFASTAAHDIKNPLSSIMLTSQALQARLATTGDTRSRSLADMTYNSSKKLLTLVDEMLQYSKAPASLLSNQQSFELGTLLFKVAELISIPPGFKLNYPNGENNLVCSSVALEQIFLNLINNAVRYNDKDRGIINITFEETGDFYNFKVADNGMGIAEKNLAKIFQKEVTLNVIDRFNAKGTGLGLHTVKSLVEKLKGTITVTSRTGEGTTFAFSIKKNVNVDEDELNAF